MRILIVDDDPVHAEKLAAWTESRGHEVLHARTAEDANWLAALLRFDVAFLDDGMGLPVGDMAARLEESSPLIRCVLVSARPASELCAGTLPFLQKPLEPEPVHSLLRELELENAGSRVILRVGFPLIRTGRRAPRAE